MSDCLSYTSYSKRLGDRVNELSRGNPSLEVRLNSNEFCTICQEAEINGLNLVQFDDVISHAVSQDGELNADTIIESMKLFVKEG